MNASGRHASAGFTLLEVLVALVIVGLGMMAVFEQLNQAIGTLSRLRDKTFATWIAEDRLTELQASGAYPEVGQQSDTIEMARAEWAYTLNVSQIPERDMRRIDVTVSFADSPDDILAEVAGFVAPPPERGLAAGGGRPAIGNDFGAGWEPANIGTGVQ